MAGVEESEIRHYFCTLRNLRGRAAGRQRFIRRSGDGAQREREQEAGAVPEICTRNPGCAAAGGGRSAVETWFGDADGSDGHSVSSGRPDSRIPGGGRQSAERSTSA